ncbi:MAG TPA: 50S ribosomal protein L21 [Planctomycetota bacterium]|nr:50S ribosomal protein L21 [Planctomycetota bacterium]
MYAVVRDGGHQFRAVPGEKVDVELRAAKPGEQVVFDQVLLVGGDQIKVGTPVVAGAKVVAVVEGESLSDKSRGIRKRDNNSSQTRFGHRQKYTTVTIKEIVAG